MNATSAPYRTTTYALMQAIRGPIMLITFGVLVALDYFQGLSFKRSWPVLFIVFGLMKLLERLGQTPVDSGPPVYPGSPAPPRGGNTL